MEEEKEAAAATLPITMTPTFILSATAARSLIPRARTVSGGQERRLHSHNAQARAHSRLQEQPTRSVYNYSVTSFPAVSMAALIGSLIKKYNALLFSFLHSATRWEWPLSRLPLLLLPFSLVLSYGLSHTKLAFTVLFFILFSR